MNKSRTYKMTVCALMAAIMCILGPMSIPIGVIPVSLTNFVIYISLFLIGTKGTVVSYVIYLLLGAVGLPVFSSYQGGLAKLTGPTGGYLIGFIFMIIISGLFMNFPKFINKTNKINAVVMIGFSIIGMILGTVVAYGFGTAWFVFEMKTTLKFALDVCVYPFIVFDLGKIVIGTFLGMTVRKGLEKAEYI